MPVFGDYQRKRQRLMRYVALIELPLVVAGISVLIGSSGGGNRLGWLLLAAASLVALIGFALGPLLYPRPLHR